MLLPLLGTWLVGPKVGQLPDIVVRPCEPAPTLVRAPRLTTPGVGRSALDIREAREESILNSPIRTDQEGPINEGLTRKTTERPTNERPGASKSTKVPRYRKRYNNKEQGEYEVHPPWYLAESATEDIDICQESRNISAQAKGVTGTPKIWWPDRPTDGLAAGRPDFSSPPAAAP